MLPPVEFDLGTINSLLESMGILKPFNSHTLLILVESLNPKDQLIYYFSLMIPLLSRAKLG